jgi:hypothetical protein
MPNPDVVAAFGAQRTVDGAFTLMVINKDLGNTSPFTASFTNLTVIGTAQRWQLTASNVIAQLPNLALTNAVLRDSLPSQSITLYVLPVPQPFQLQLKPDQTPGGLSLTLNGQPGASYTMQSSTDLIHWLAFSTNTLTTNSVQIVVATTNSAQMFYRGVFVQP